MVSEKIKHILREQLAKSTLRGGTPEAGADRAVYVAVLALSVRVSTSIPATVPSCYTL
jgi:hypothetical protein